jgi:hypothetical protein
VSNHLTPNYRAKHLQEDLDFCWVVERTYAGIALLALIWILVKCN